MVTQNALDLQFVPHRMKDACDVDDYFYFFHKTAVGQRNESFCFRDFKMWGKNIAVVFTGLGSPVLCSTMKLTLALWASRMDVGSSGSLAALCVVEAFIRVKKNFLQ